METMTLAEERFLRHRPSLESFTSGLGGGLIGLLSWVNAEYSRATGAGP